MSKTEGADLKELERSATEALAHSGLPDDEVAEEQLAPEAPLPVLRLSIVIGFPVLAAAVMVGGVFIGFSTRPWAAFAGFFGIAVAVFARKLRNPLWVNLSIIGGVLTAGIILAVPAGSIQNVVDLATFVKKAVASGAAAHPPVLFDLGWRAIVGWLMAGLGFASGWLAIEMARPSLGILASLPIVIIGAISVPDSAKIATGLITFALFTIGLGLLSSVDLSGEGEQRSLGYELRRLARALPVIVGITGGLALVALNTTFLFPDSIINPAQNAQRPKYIPIKDVPDRVLFVAESSVSGPWRMGGLDVYEDNAWRLAPFEENQLAPVPRDGIVDRELAPGLKATFEIRDLGGAILPGLPDLVGIVAQGPLLAYDGRNANIRLAEGTIESGLIYTVTAAKIPTIEELQKVNADPPREIRQFLEMPEGPPPAVRDLLDKAPKTSTWDKLDYIRTTFLDTVVASGQGRPKDVPVSRVQEMLAGNHKGTPFEIVAAQAMLARWAGVPARIGYGFDGGDKTPQGLEIRPKHGASFLEVYMPGYKWLPIIGKPRQATSTLGNEQTQQDRDLLASDDISVKIFYPIPVSSKRFLFEQIRYAVLVSFPFVLLALLIYFSIPLIRKTYRRSRIRTFISTQGPHARIGLVYAEFRDYATDLGYRHHSDTPLMFLDRTVPDEEHAELAWLVTRALWGDMRDRVTEDDVLAAEELARALRRRMSQAHSATLRAIAAMSRLSLKHPYAPTLDAPGRRERRDETKKAA